MPVSHRTKEAANLVRAFTVNRSGVRIDEQSRFTTERDLGGRAVDADLQVVPSWA